MSNHTTHTPFTVRLARSSDSRQLAQLAALDSAAVPTGDVLVTELDGRLVAAVPVAGGRVVADPFVRTQAIVELLELRASQLRAAGYHRPTGFLARIEELLARPAVRVN